MSATPFEINFAFEKLTVNTATALTAATYGNSVGGALITVETDQVRFRTDGTAPDSTTGHLLNVGDVLVLSSPSDVQRVKFIKVTNNATLQVSYYR